MLSSSQNVVSTGCRYLSDFNFLAMVLVIDGTTMGEEEDIYQTDARYE